MKPVTTTFKAILIISMSVLLLVVNPLSVGMAWAQCSLILSTPYPGLEVRPGEIVQFPLEILNQGITPQPVTIKVVSAPEGWAWSLTGQGKAVHQVFAHRDQVQRLDLKLELPPEVKEGNYQIAVQAAGGGASSRLLLDLEVSAQSKQEGQLQIQYPQLEGPAGASFKFRLDLANTTAKEQSYSLGAQAPPGWQVSFSPAHDSKKITSFSLKPGETQGLEVEIVPAQNVTAGNYTIPVAAIYADGTMQAELEVTITGTYDLKLTTPTGRLNASTSPGREREVTLVVENNGSADLKNISFSAWEPTNWSVRFDPDELELLPAGESKQIKAIIKPDRRSIAGDYAVSFTAAAAESKDTLEMRVLVKTSTWWGIVGIVIVIAVISTVYRLFERYGRR